MLHAILGRVQGERMVVVLNPEKVYKGITIWLDKWRRHGWKTSSGELGHRDRWEHILWLREEAGDLLQLRWVPAHLNVWGNEAAAEWAGQGQEQHPNTLLPLSKRQRVMAWDALGLEPMMESKDLRLTSDVDSGGGDSSSVQSDESDDVDLCTSSDGEELFSTDVSDTCLGEVFFH